MDARGERRKILLAALTAMGLAACGGAEELDPTVIPPSTYEPPTDPAALHPATTPTPDVSSLPPAPPEIPAREPADQTVGPPG